MTSSSYSKVRTCVTLGVDGKIKIKWRKKKMEEKVKEAIERNFEIDNQEIGRLVSEGNTSGILDNEAGYRIFWDLKVDKFQNN